MMILGVSFRRQALLFSIGLGVGSLMEWTMIRSGYYASMTRRYEAQLEELEAARVRLATKQVSQPVQASVNMVRDDK